MCAQHYNLGMCVGKKLQRGPRGQALHGFSLIPCLPNIQQADRAGARGPRGALRGFHLREEPTVDVPPSFLPCVHVAAAAGGWRGLGDAEFPRSSGSLARIGDERTWWHRRFLYKQRVGVAPEQTLRIIGDNPQPATWKEK